MPAETGRLKIGSNR